MLGSSDKYLTKVPKLLMKRRTFLRYIIGSFLLAQGGSAGAGQVIFSRNQSDGPVRKDSFLDDKIKDYLVKIRNPDLFHPEDIILKAEERRLLATIVARLKRVRRIVGDGNFCVIGFDDARRYAKQYASIEPFPNKELEFLEKVYSENANRYGFMGEKQMVALTYKINRHQVKKIPGSGNYLFKGDSLRKYETIKKDLGDKVLLTSGIRGVVKQFYLFLNKANRHDGNLSLASRSLAPPGYSYHATGDFDIGQKGFGVANFSRRFTTTDVFKNLQQQGFVDYRYEEDNMLGVRYEPWHIKLR